MSITEGYYCPQAGDRTQARQEPPRDQVCPGHGTGGTAPPCCGRAGQFDGGAGGEYPRDFVCPKGCWCHD